MDFEVYTGKANNSSKSSTPLGERVVKKLTRELRESESLVAFDNYFTSVYLVSDLCKDEIYSIGTVRVNRDGLPNIMKNKNKMQRGKYMYQTKDGVSAIKWMDFKVVTLLSSTYNAQTITTVKRKMKNGKRIQVSCPAAVAQLTIK